MAGQGEQLAQQILNDLACPGCEYNLRGLRGPVVQCPECGVQCDIPKMIARRWTRPWWEAPGFNRLITPLTFLVIAACGLFVALIVEVESRGGSGIATATLALAVLMVWLGLLHWASKPFEGERGIALTALLHLLFVGYLAGTVGSIALVVRALGSSTAIEALVFMVPVPLLVAMLVFCRKGERFVAEQCIKRYLRIASDPATAAG